MADPNATDPYAAQYDLARKRASQQTNAGAQAQKDALQRRFAAMGNINSGAYIKANENVDEAAQQNLEQANEGINAQQGADVLRRQETQAQRDFAAQEAEKGRQFGAEQQKQSQQFQAEQGDIQRKYQTGERLSAHDLSVLDTAAQQKYATGERLSSQDFQHQGQQDQLWQQKQQFEANLEFQKHLKAFDEIKWKAQSDLAYKQYDMDREAQTYNQGLSEEMRGKDNSILGSLFSSVLPSGVNRYVGSHGGAGKFSGIFNSAAAPATLGGFLGGGGGGGGLF